MPDLTIDIVKAWFAENKDLDEVKTFLTEITPEVQVTSELVQPFLETQAGKELVQPISDRRVSEALKTYKEGHYSDELKADVAKEILRLNPQETSEAKQIRELRDEIGVEKKARQQDILRRQIVEEAARESIPSWWVDDFSGNTIDEAKVFLGKVKAHDVAIAEKVRNELLSDGFKPGSGDKGQDKKIDLSKLSDAEVRQLEVDGELDALITQ